MLTYSALKTVAYWDPEAGEDPICPECARKRWGTLAVAKAEARIEPTPCAGVIEYNMDEMTNHFFDDFAYNVEHGDVDPPEGFDPGDPDTYPDYVRYPECPGLCGRCFTGGAEPWQAPVDGRIPARVASADDNRWTM